MQVVIVWLFLLPVGVFYFMFWRPQQRRILAVRTLQAELREGDEVLTTSGIFARVVRLGDNEAELEIAPGTVMRIARGAIGQVLTDHGDESFDAHGDGAGAD